MNRIFIIKRLLLAVIFCLTLQSSISFGSDIKMYFADSMSSENSTIQPYLSWYFSSEDGKTTTKQMYAEGWKLIQVVKLSAVASQKQFWLFFEK